MIIEEIKKKIKKFLGWNENENTTDKIFGIQQRRNHIYEWLHLKNQINNLMIDIPEGLRWKEIMKIWLEINEVETNWK
jgi:hypothetical protein